MRVRDRARLFGEGEAAPIVRANDLKRRLARFDRRAGEGGSGILRRAGEVLMKPLNFTSGFLVFCRGLFALPGTRGRGFNGRSLSTLRIFNLRTNRNWCTVMRRRS